MSYMNFLSVIRDSLGGRDFKLKGVELIGCCPFHNEKNPSFGINIDTGLYNCFSCGEKGNIVQFISKMRSISEEQAKEIVMNEVGFLDTQHIPYSLQEFAEEKKLPIDFLQENNVTSVDGYRISFLYYDEERNLAKVRYRNSPKSDTKCFWRTDNSPLIPYGLWKLPFFKRDYIVLVEGETDALSLWYHGIPAIGIPGANNYKKHYSEYIKDFNRIYIHSDEDEAAQNFLRDICKSGIKYEKLYKISSKSINVNCKDPSDLHINNLLNKDTFLEKAVKIDRDYFNEVNRSKTPEERHVKIAEQVLDEMNIKYYNSNFYVYENGVYKENLSAIEQCIQQVDTNAKKSLYAETLNYIRVKQNHKQLAIDENLINFRNGIFNITNNELENHTPDIFTVCQLNVDYLNDEEFNNLIKERKNKYIDKFLSDVCCRDITKINALLEFLGYSMTYSIELGKCLFVLGSSAENGKSTALELISHLYNEENIASIAIEEFAERFCGSELNNKLINIVHEVQNVRVKDVSKFKTVVTGNLITVEEKYKPRYKMKPFTHHIFAMNNLPEIVNEKKDEGFFRRLHIIEFNAKFTDEEKEAFDFNKLITVDSLNYLANLALRKYLDMRRNNRRKFSNDSKNKELVAKYKDEDNSALMFINDESIFIDMLDTKKRITKTGLFSVYTAWCKTNKYKALEKKDFYQCVINSNRFSEIKLDGYDCFKYKEDNELVSNIEKLTEIKDNANLLENILEEERLK